MINYETILSNYEDKLTLMQWLDKVEAALKDATATGFHLNKTGNATFTFSIDFDDGTTLTSEPVVVNQGESVASAAINNGVLTLTLTNGQVLSAGNIFNGNLTLNGDLICPYIDVSGDIDCGGKLGVVGKTNLFGDLEVTGNILNDGYLKPSTSALQFDEDLNLTFLESAFTENGTFTNLYSHARVSNGKLTLVFTWNYLCNTTFTSQDAIMVNSPVVLNSTIVSRLYPIETNRNTLDMKSLGLLMTGSGGVANSPVDMQCWVFKASSYSLMVTMRPLTSITYQAGYTYAMRYEVNFIL